MKVYMVRYDAQDRIVEAESFHDCILAWQSWLAADLKASGNYDPGDENTEPESVMLMSEEYVIRPVYMGGEHALLQELLQILGNHAGERGRSEGAVETLRRIIVERNDAQTTILNDASVKRSP